MKVPPLVLSMVKKCPNNFSCLKENGTCKVTDTISKEVFFIENNQKHHYCPYKMDFGFSQVCNCPVFQYLQNNQEN